MTTIRDNEHPSLRELRVERAARQRFDEERRSRYADLGHYPDDCAWCRQPADACECG
jgi:hypothetical protein